MHLTQSCHGMVRRSFATNMATCPGHALSYMKLDGARLEHHHRDLGERSFKLVCLWLCTADHFSMCLVTCFACIQLAGSVMQWHRLFFSNGGSRSFVVHDLRLDAFARSPQPRPRAGVRLLAAFCLCCFCPVSWAVFTLTAAYTQTCNVRHRGETQHFMRCGTDTAECGLLDCDQASGDLADADTDVSS